MNEEKKLKNMIQIVAQMLERGGLIKRIQQNETEYGKQQQRLSVARKCVKDVPHLFPLIRCLSLVFFFASSFGTVCCSGYTRSCNSLLSV